MKNAMRTPAKISKGKSTKDHNFTKAGKPRLSAAGKAGERVLKMAKQETSA